MGKDLSGYFKQAAVKSCDYDPSITSRSVPLVQNEAYQLLLRTAMEKGEKGAWAKGQLEGIQTTMEQMIATGVSLGVHVMTNQGGKAWGDVIKLTSSVAQLDSYNLFRTNKPEDQAKPEDSKNAFYKSIDSFKEIGTGFVGTLRTRADKATDSPYDFFNWLTLGITGDIPVGIYEAAKDRSEHMFDSKEKFADWLTLGTVEMAKGAFNPDEAWSADHWLNSLGMVTLLYGPVEKSLLPTGGGGLKPPKGLDSVKSFEIQKPLPAFSTNEGFQFKINNLDVDTPALPQTPMQINFKNEMDRILREKMEGKSESNHSIKDVEVKAVEGTGKIDDISPAFKQNEFSSAYESRYNQTPALENPKVGFEGERGESKCILKPPPDPELKKILDEAGIDGINYKNAVPDFSPVAKAELEIDHMLGGTGNRGADARRANFKQADIKLAEQLNNSPELASQFGLTTGKIKAGDIADIREELKLTWHELNDGKTMQLVPLEINSKFGHLGGVGEINAGAFAPGGFAKN